MTAHQIGDGGICVLCGGFSSIGDGGYCPAVASWWYLAEQLYARFGNDLWREGMMLLDKQARGFRILSVWLTDLTLATEETVYAISVETPATWKWSWSECGVHLDDASPPLLLDLRDAGTGGILLERFQLGPDDRLWYAKAGWHICRAGGRTYVGATLGEVAAKWLLEVA
jgi:hypothetical protein